MMKHLTPDGGYLPALDGLRGIGVLFVLWNHGTVLFGVPPNNIFWNAGVGAWMGVDLFFVVSGFLITGILLRGRNQTTILKRFWIRRALRILPLHFLYLATLLSVSLAAGRYPVMSDLGQSWPFFVFLGNFAIAINHSWMEETLGIMWSLAIEEQFYLIWPFVIRFMPVRWALGAGAILLVFAPCIRAWMAPHGHIAVYVSTISHYDGLLIGSMLAIVAANDKWRPILGAWCRRLWPLSLVIVAFFLAYPIQDFRTSPRLSLIVFSLLSIGFAILVGMVTNPPVWYRKVFEAGWLVRTGQLCYGMYIWQVFVGEIVRHGVKIVAPDLIGFYGQIALWVVTVYAAAFASWHLWERPFLNLKETLAPAYSSKSASGGIAARAQSPAQS